jgi:hypothetical protein
MANALTAAGLDANAAPTTAATSSSESRATVSTVPSGEADHVKERALQAT